MKVGVCCFGPIQSEYYNCGGGGHGKSFRVANVNYQVGFLEQVAFRTIGRKNGAPIVSASVEPGLYRGAVQVSQQQLTLSSIVSDRSLSAPADSEGHGVLLRSWAPSVQTAAVGRRWVTINCSPLSTASRGGWEEKQGNVAAGRTSAATRWKVKSPKLLQAPHFPTARACAAVSGGEEKALLQQAPERAITPSSPREHRGDFMYRPFADFAVEELSRRPDVSPLLLKEEFRNMTAPDIPIATIDNKAFTSSKIRMFRIASIDTGRMQVLNVAGFARPDYNLPIFCADFFSAPNRNIVVLDLNPLYHTDSGKGYKELFYADLLPLANKYIKLLPWGDKLTAESLQFFSPLVLWTKPQTEDIPRFLYPAFQEYLQAWLNLVDSAHPSVDAVTVARNQEAQHRYISWRTTKDPGRPLLTKLCGEHLAERYIKEFLFSGHSALGTKSFLDYFPEYRNEDGSILKQRSMIGRSFETRPWDKDGNFFPK